MSTDKVKPTTTVYLKTDDSTTAYTDYPVVTPSFANKTVAQLKIMYEEALEAERKANLKQFVDTIIDKYNDKFFWFESEPSNYHTIKTRGVVHFYKIREDQHFSEGIKVRYCSERVFCKFNTELDMTSVRCGNTPGFGYDESIFQHASSLSEFESSWPNLGKKTTRQVFLKLLARINSIAEQQLGEFTEGTTDESTEPSRLITLGKL